MTRRRNNRGANRDITVLPTGDNKQTHPTFSLPLVYYGYWCIKDESAIAAQTARMKLLLQSLTLSGYDTAEALEQGRVS